MLAEDFEIPKMSITNLTPNVTMATSGRNDETDLQAVGKDFSLVIID